MAIVLRKKSVKQPETVSIDVSDAESNEPPKVEKPRATKINYNQLNREARAQRELEERIKAKKLLKGSDKSKTSATSVKTKKDVHSAKSENRRDSSATAGEEPVVRRRGRPKLVKPDETKNNENSKPEKKSELPPRKRLGFMKNRSRKMYATNGAKAKTVVLPKFRSARLKARASVKAVTASLKRNPVVQLDESEVTKYTKENNSVALKAKKTKETVKKEEPSKDTPGNHLNLEDPESLRRLKETKRPRDLIPSRCLPPGSDISDKLDKEKVIGSSKRKVFTPVRKSVLKKGKDDGKVTIKKEPKDKNYILEIKQLAQKKTASKESTGETEIKTEEKEPEEEEQASRKMTESSVLNINLSPSKMKLLEARNKLKRKLDREENGDDTKSRRIDFTDVGRTIETRKKQSSTVEVPKKFPEKEFRKQLKELDSKNKDATKIELKVNENESSSKLSKLIDSVAGRLTSSPTFPEETVDKNETPDVRVKSPENTPQYTKPPSPDVDSGAALVGPMIPLGHTVSNRSQVQSSASAMTHTVPNRPQVQSSTSTKISPVEFGGMASVEVKSAGGDKIVVGSKPSEGGKAVYFRLTPQSVTPSSTTIQVRPGHPVTLPSQRAEVPKTAGVKILRTGEIANMIKRLKGSDNPTKIVVPDYSQSGPQSVRPSLLQLTQASGSSASKLVLIRAPVQQKPTTEASQPFLSEKAPIQGWEPQINKTTHSDTLDSNEVEFKSQGPYDSVEDMLNLMDSSSPEFGENCQQNLAGNTERSDCGEQQSSADSGVPKIGISSSCSSDSLDMLASVVKSTIGHAIEPELSSDEMKEFPSPHNKDNDNMEDDSDIGRKETAIAMQLIGGGAQRKVVGDSHVEGCETTGVIQDENVDPNHDECPERSDVTHGENFADASREEGPENTDVNLEMKVVNTVVNADEGHETTGFVENTYSNQGDSVVDNIVEDSHQSGSVIDDGNGVDPTCDEGHESTGEVLEGDVVEDHENRYDDDASVENDDNDSEQGAMEDLMENYSGHDGEGFLDGDNVEALDNDDDAESQECGTEFIHGDEEEMVSDHGESYNEDEREREEPDDGLCSEAGQEAEVEDVNDEMHVMEEPLEADPNHVDGAELGSNEAEQSDEDNKVPPISQSEERPLLTSPELNTADNASVDREDIFDKVAELAKTEENMVSEPDEIEEDEFFGADKPPNSDSDSDFVGECLDDSLLTPVEKEPARGNSDFRKAKSSAPSSPVKTKRRRSKSSGQEDSLISPRTALLDNSTSFRKTMKSRKRKRSESKETDPLVHGTNSCKDKVPMYAVFKRNVAMTRTKRSKKNGHWKHYAQVVDIEPSEVDDLPDQDLEISSYQVVAMIRQGRDHYGRCPRQLSRQLPRPGSEAAYYEHFYTQFLMQYKQPESQSRKTKKKDTSYSHLLLHHKRPSLVEIS